MYVFFFFFLRKSSWVDPPLCGDEIYQLNWNRLSFSILSFKFFSLFLYPYDVSFLVKETRYHSMRLYLRKRQVIRFLFSRPFLMIPLKDKVNMDTKICFKYIPQLPKGT